MNPFQLFRTSLSSTYGQKMKSKRFEHLRTFPRLKEKNARRLSSNRENGIVSTYVLDG